MYISIFKVKKGKKNKLKKWGEEIEKRKNEAIETLVEENCLEERFSFFEISGETYAVGVMVPKVGEKFSAPNLENKLNKKHFKILKECLLSEIPQEKVYQLRVG